MLRFIGITGYSIYLWHMPIILLLSTNPGLINLDPAEKFPLLLAATTGAMVVIGTIAYLVVEKPFMLWGRKSSG